MSAKIHHEILINASPKRVYEALANADQFAEFTGIPAEIDLTPGGKISAFGGMITGQTIEAIPNTRLVQVWRVGNWEAGAYSIARFEFEAQGDSKTKLIFDHTGFPEEHGDHLDDGWHERYWKPLKIYLDA